MPLAKAISIDWLQPSSKSDCGGYVPDANGAYLVVTATGSNDQPLTYLIGAFSGNSGVSDGVPSGQEDGILDKGLDYAGRTNDGVDAFAKTLGINGLTAVMVSGGKTLGRYSGLAGVAINAGQVFNGIRKDGYTYGYNAQKATAGAVGGFMGAWAGFKVGACAGFEGGFALGLYFEGIGAIPGAVIGGIICGFGGALGGAYGGNKLGESLISNKAQ
jgi:hypothetical protein